MLVQILHRRLKGLRISSKATSATETAVTSIYQRHMLMMVKYIPQQSPAVFPTTGLQSQGTTQRLDNVTNGQNLHPARSIPKKSSRTLETIVFNVLPLKSPASTIKSIVLTAAPKV